MIFSSRIWKENGGDDMMHYVSTYIDKMVAGFRARHKAFNASGEEMLPLVLSRPSQKVLLAIFIVHCSQLRGLSKIT